MARPLHYSINITLDGCCDHREGIADRELHENASASIANADALIFGRVIYQMMEEAWRPVAETGVRPDWMDEWMVPFAHTIHKAKKYVVSDSLTHVDWNAELIRGHELEAKIRELKGQPGRGISTGGVTLPKKLAALGLIDHFEFIVHPRIAGRGPTLLDGLPKGLDLKLTSRKEFASGAQVLKYSLK